jgi:Flp pilus assembly protein TadG
MRARIDLELRQRGAVAVTTALMLVVLLGFFGVVVDLGRMYVAKTELSNAADACALAAGQELDSNSGALTRAENAGITAGTRNLADFQNVPVAITAADIKFSATLSPNSDYLTQAAGAAQNSKYVMCSLTFPGLPTTLAGIVGFGPTVNVGAQAVATVSPAQTSCAVPLGICGGGPPPNYGLTPGGWFSGKFDAGGGTTGSFNWIDFTPPSGGQAELAALLTGPGVCNTYAGAQVGQTGVLGNAAARAWNSRFGLYQSGAGNPQLGTAPPDYTGFSYTATPQGNAAWPAQSNALSDFLSPRRNPNNNSYQGNAATGLSISNAYNIITPAQHAAFGVATRRLIVSPIVDCTGWATSQTVPILGYGCVLMLHPIGSPGDTVYLEYVGAASDKSSPCATAGLAGGSFGPLVPVLVQ